MTDDRIACCVVGCRRTRKAGQFPEWICAVHWPMVSRRTRAKYTLIKRIARKRVRRDPMVSIYWHMQPGSPQRIKAVRMWALMKSIWEACKREAQERAVGL